MRVTKIGLTIAAAALTASVAAPAWASHAPTKPTHDRSTNILLKAGKSSVAPKHKESLTATLKSGHHRLAGESLWLEQRDKSTHKFDGAVSAGTTDANGQVVLSVIPGNSAGDKVQYRVVFQGDTGYKASHSAVITVTVSSPSS